LGGNYHDELSTFTGFDGLLEFDKDFWIFSIDVVEGTARKPYHFASLRDSQTFVSFLENLDSQVCARSFSWSIHKAILADADSGVNGYTSLEKQRRSSFLSMPVAVFTNWIVPDMSAKPLSIGVNAESHLTETVPARGLETIINEISKPPAPNISHLPERYQPRMVISGKKSSSLGTLHCCPLPSPTTTNPGQG
jgi:hypothetical protein